MKKYVKIENENEALLVKDLYISRDNTVFPVFIESNGEDWFDIEDIADNVFNNILFEDSKILNDCRRYARESISVKKYVKEKLNKENQ